MKATPLQTSCNYIEIIIEGTPTPWAAHQGYGKRSYNPRSKQKAHAISQIRNQFSGFPLEGAVSIEVKFFLPIPKAYTKKKRHLIELGVESHIKKPDVDNMLKFLGDCLKTIVFLDDAQVTEIVAQKVYSDHPRTVVTIKPV